MHNSKGSEQMEIDEQEQIVTEQLQELALQEIEGVAAGLIIAGEYLDHILHKDDAASLEKQKPCLPY